MYIHQKLLAIFCAMFLLVGCSDKEALEDRIKILEEKLQRQKTEQVAAELESEQRSNRIMMMQNRQRWEMEDDARRQKSWNQLELNRVESQMRLDAEWRRMEQSFDK